MDNNDVHRLAGNLSAALQTIKVLQEAHLRMMHQHRKHAVIIRALVEHLATKDAGLAKLLDEANGTLQEDEHLFRLKHGDIPKPLRNNDEGTHGR